LLNFADLTIPMLLFHFVTFDPNWIRTKPSNAQEWVFFDGTCGLCHHVVRFVLAEDRAGLFLFSPLQGWAFSQTVAEDDRRRLPDSLVVVDHAGRILLRSDAVIHIATRLGGIWRVLGAILAVVPKLIRDGGYRLVGINRHQFFSRPGASCPVLPPRLRARFTE
jgi:predicted DCC family thiol-disulfide oxidoreductase YuxK